jgi:6-phosphogluconolactonase
MPYSLYICLLNENKIAAFAMDADTGHLTPQAEVPAVGGPAVLAISPDRHVLYVGHRVQPAILSFRIDHHTGGLTPQGTVSLEHAPTFLATDRTGKYLLSAYYQGGYAAVHPLAEDSAIEAPSLDRLATATGAHAIQTDPSNQYAFVPHIARLNDNVLEPPREAPGPNVILQFKFDVHTGHLTPNSPFRVEQAERLGPPATIAFIPPKVSSISLMSRAAVSPAIVWTPQRAPFPLCKRSRPCPTGTPRVIPVLRFI